MTWLWIILGVAAALLLLLCLAASVLIMKVVKPHRHTEESMRAEEVGLGFQDAVERYEGEWPRTPFTLESCGVTLSGEYIVNPADTWERKRVVIVCHGHTCNRYKSVKYADMFYRAGYSIVLYDERYFGRSTGDFCTLGQEETKDLLNVMAYTREIFGEDCVIGLHGESMGAATVLLCLASEKPDFVVADCPFASSMMLFRHIMEDGMHLPPYPLLWLVDPVGGLLYRYRPGKVNPIDAVAGSQVPICFMHGTADTLIPCEHSKLMREKCKNPASELHLFVGAEHACSVVVDREGYEEKLLAFAAKAAPAPVK